MQNKPAHIAPNWVDKRKDVRLFGSWRQYEKRAQTKDNID